MPYRTMREEELVHRSTILDRDLVAYKSLMDGSFDENEFDSDSEDEEEDIFDLGSDGFEKGGEEEAGHNGEPYTSRGRSFEIRMTSLYSEVEHALGEAVKSLGSSRCGEQAEDIVKRNKEYLSGNNECKHGQNDLGMPTKLAQGKQKSLFSHFRDTWDMGSIGQAITSTESTNSWEKQTEKADSNFISFLEKAKEDFQHNFDLDSTDEDDEVVMPIAATKTPASIQGLEFTDHAAFGVGKAHNSCNIFASVSETPVILGQAKDIGEGFLLRTRSNPEPTKKEVKGTNRVRSRSFEGVDPRKICAINRLTARTSHSIEEDLLDEQGHLLDITAPAKTLWCIMEEEETVDIEQEDKADAHFIDTKGKCVVAPSTSRNESDEKRCEKQTNERVELPKRPAFLTSIMKKGLTREKGERRPTSKDKMVSDSQEMKKVKFHQFGVGKRVRRQFKKMNRVRQEGRCKCPEHIYIPEISCYQESHDLKRENGNFDMRGTEYDRYEAEECIIFGDDMDQDATAFPEQAALGRFSLASIAADQCGVEVTAASIRTQSTQRIETRTNVQLMSLKLPEDELLPTTEASLPSGDQQHRPISLRNESVSFAGASSVRIDSHSNVHTTTLCQEHECVLDFNCTAGKEKADDRNTETVYTRRPTVSLSAHERFVFHRVKCNDFEELSKMESMKVGHKGWKKKISRLFSKKKEPKRSGQEDKLPLIKVDSEPAHHTKLENKATEESSESPSFDVPESKSSLSFPESMQNTSMLNVICAMHAELDKLVERPRRQATSPTPHFIPLEEC